MLEASVGFLGGSQHSRRCEMKMRNSILIHVVNTTSCFNHSSMASEVCLSKAMCLQTVGSWALSSNRLAITFTSLIELKPERAEVFRAFFDSRLQCFCAVIILPLLLLRRLRNSLSNDALETRSDKADKIPIALLAFFSLPNSNWRTRLWIDCATFGSLTTTWRSHRRWEKSEWRRLGMQRDVSHILPFASTMDNMCVMLRVRERKKQIIKIKEKVKY